MGLHPKYHTSQIGTRHDLDSSLAMSSHTLTATLAPPVADINEMFHVFVRTISGVLVATIAVAPDDFCHTLCLEITSLFKCNTGAFSLLVEDVILAHDDMVSERLSDVSNNVTILWHDEARGVSESMNGTSLSPLHRPNDYTDHSMDRMST